MYSGHDFGAILFECSNHTIALYVFASTPANTVAGAGMLVSLEIIHFDL
jgi:hypothetical protein